MVNDSTLVGDVWIAGARWTVTSFGLEANNGTCSLPAAILCHFTVVHAAESMSASELAEFVSAFNFAMLLHGHCSRVDPVAMLDLLQKHFAVQTTPANEVRH